MVKRVIFILVLAVLFIPFFQRQFHPVSSMGLKGSYIPASKPDFACSTWFAGNYQEQYMLYYNESAGFRPDYVRLFTQLDYSVFQVPHGDQIVIGKDGILFQEGYVNGYLGKNFPGRSFINERMEKLAYVQNLLWKKKNILLMVVIPPDKGSFWPEKLPSRYKKDPRDNHCKRLFRFESQRIWHPLNRFRSLFFKDKRYIQVSPDALYRDSLE